MKGRPKGSQNGDNVRTRQQYGAWAVVGTRPAMVHDWREDANGCVEVQLGADGPFERLLLDAVEPISEAEWYRLMADR